MSFGEENEGENEKTSEKLSYSAIMSHKISSMTVKADEALREGDYRRCISILSRAIALDPHNPELFRTRAEAHFQLSDYPAAVANYRKTVSLSPSEAAGLAPRMADAYYKNGCGLRNRNDVTSALEAFTKASELCPNEREYIMQRIDCLLSLRHYDDCLTLIQIEIDHGILTPQLYLIHAKISLIFEKNAEVHQSLMQALELDPTHQEAIKMKAKRVAEAKKLRSQAVKFLLLGQRDGAMSKISTAIECDPEEAEYHVLKGAIHRQTGSYTKAVDELLTAVDKSGGEGGKRPVYEAARRQLVLTYNDFAVHCFKLKKYDEAISLLNKALEDEKTEAGLYVNRGDCFYQLNNVYFAMADYCQAQHLTPDNWHVRCRAAITQCELGVKEFGGRNLEEADKLFTAAIDNNPKISRFYLCRSRVKYELEQIEAAKEDLLRVLVLEPECDGCLPLIARLFPGKEQSDLLTGPTFTASSDKLMQIISEGEKCLADKITPESVAQRRERELLELFAKLGLDSDKTTPTNYQKTTPINYQKATPTVTTRGGQRARITPVIASPSLPNIAPRDTTPSCKPSADVSPVKRDALLNHEQQTVTTSNNHRQISPPPRSWPVLSLPLPPIEALMGPRGREGVWSVVPNRSTCQEEREFNTQLYYSKRNCTAEVQREIQRSPSVISPPSRNTQ